MEYSIVVPVYNSSNSLIELTNRLLITMKNKEVEIILVDDGSSDDSWKKLERIKESNTDSEIKIIKLSKNFGQQNATLCGLKHASGKYLITIDDDLQIPPEEIHKLISTITDSRSEIVYGIYKYQQQEIQRNILKKIAFVLLKKINPTIDKKSSFRIIKKDLVLHLIKHTSNFVNIDEIAQWYTSLSSTVEVEHLPRKEGKSGYNLYNLIKLSFNILFNFYAFPLQLITIIGFYTSILSIALGLFFVIKKIFFNVSIEGWTSLMVVLLFSTGIIVFSLGIIGKYLLQVISIQNEKPSYIINTISE